jgi:hypothetical protein
VFCVRAATGACFTGTIVLLIGYLYYGWPVHIAVWAQNVKRRLFIPAPHHAAAVDIPSYPPFYSPPPFPHAPATDIHASVA